jgi:peptide deformylase
VPIEELRCVGQARPIVRWGAPGMHSRTRPVEDFGPALQELLSDMFATNAAADGAGLAAPQIGEDLAVFVYDCADGAGIRRVGVVCNPVLELPVGRERRLESDEEGCLSLPGAFMPLARPDRAICRGQDQFGDEVEIVGTGTLARCLQHETDHLDGMVFGDRLSKRSRKQLHHQHERLADRYSPEWPVA